MRIGMGCVGLGTATGRRTFGTDVRLVRAALDAGVTVLDTADAYGNGMSERIIGCAIEHRRDVVELATKGGYVFRPRSRAELALRREVVGLRARLDRSPAGGSGGGDHGSYRSQDFSPGALRGALEASLRRLGTDHVDVYQLHGPPGVLPDVMPVLQRFVDEGKVGRLGVGAEDLVSAEAWSRIEGIEVIQLPVGVLEPHARTVVQEIGARGREVWARSVFGGGVLKAAGDPAAHPNAPSIDALASLAERHGISLFALAYGFVRALPGVSTVLLGMSRREHLDENLKIISAGPLSDELLGEIDGIVDSMGTGTGPA